MIRYCLPTLPSRPVEFVSSVVNRCFEAGRIGLP